MSAKEIEKFVPTKFFESPGLIVVLIDLEAKVRATGKRIVEEDEFHVWYLNDKHQVTRFRHRVATQQHFSAYRGVEDGAANEELKLTKPSPDGASSG